MILHAVFREGSQPQLPCLVWLHGFLGRHQEWMPISAYFNEWPQLWIDLPGHGDSINQQVTDFASVDTLLTSTLHHYHINDYWLIGYSLGGRLAMYHATYGQAFGLRGLVVEGSHPGLSDDSDREPRQCNDHYWATRFCNEELSQVLDDWYRQPIFSDLNEQQRTELVASRSQNDPVGLAMVLDVISLARQPDLHIALSQLTIPFYYLCGERDAKFRAIATSLGLTPKLILGAGHNAHREAPATFSMQLLTLLRDSNFKDR